MRIGKLNPPVSAICTSDEHSITIRGKNLCRDLMGQVSLTELLFFLVSGQLPTDDQRFITDAVLVSLAEHGLTPSVQAARMTLAASPEALQGAVAAGLLGCGSVVLGSTEPSGRFLAQLIDTARTRGETMEETAKTTLQEMRAQKKMVPGYGHPLHTGGDPRAIRLLELTRERGLAGEHVAALETVSRLLPDIYGRTMFINVSGAIPAVMLDVGYPIAGLKGLPLLARTAGLIGHLVEDIGNPLGFLLAHHGGEAISYNGPLATLSE